jgi:isoleucyl-tRNA synthetase
MTSQDINSKYSSPFGPIEQQIIKYWTDHNTTQKIREQRASAPKWEFLDGPPFVNGAPHHGHALVTSIKDTMARYMSQKGYQIGYQIGFDCHGLPLEQEAEKKVGKVLPSDSIERLTEFNDECRSIISNCSSQWYKTLGRLGRQFDVTQTYYTSDFAFMKSLWWAFSELWNQGLIYKSKKVLAYSPLCSTPLSNFEAKSNYIERTDISVYVKFNIINSDEFLLIWTTTPWSLFANQGICVNSDLDYSLILVNSMDKLWICTDLINKFCIGEFSDYQIIKNAKGADLIGLYYFPIFGVNGFDNKYKVYGDPYVLSDSGTGLVHLAPLFGEDDMRVMKMHGYNDNDLPNYIIDAQCKFTINFKLGTTNIVNKFVMDTSTDIVIFLKNTRQALKSEKIKHLYPYCWRTDYPLVYLATDAWFFNVQRIIPDLIKNNDKIMWVPEYVGSERFANWIKDSPDWCLSRNRVWGTPIPVWINENEDIICIKTVEQLEQLSGQTFSDLHLDKIGNVTFVMNNTTYKRTFGVLDCWFESGMAGLSRFGYPECKNKSYPVDFVTESLDQTRGWFYTLNVLSTVFNHQPAFKKVIVSGMVLANDNKKMSKRHQNYTPLDTIIETYGADVFRLYLIGSPATKAESLCFKNKELDEITRKLLPYLNAHLLFNECVHALTLNGDTIEWLETHRSSNPIDLWISNKLIEFGCSIHKFMELMDISKIPTIIYKWIDDLTNTFVKLSRDRLKCLTTLDDCRDSLSTLYYVLNKSNILLSPYIPHLSEHFYQVIEMKNIVSVHEKTIDWNDYSKDKIDFALLNGFYSINELLAAVRNLRQLIDKPTYYPLNRITLYCNENIDKFKNIILNELNIGEIEVLPTIQLDKIYRPNKSTLGRAFKQTAYDYSKLIESGNITWNGCIPEYYTVEYVIFPKPNTVSYKFKYFNINGIETEAIVYLSTDTSRQQDIIASMNNIRAQINGLRKDMGLKLFNKVSIHFLDNDYWRNIDSKWIDYLKTKLVADIFIQPTIPSSKIINIFDGTELNVFIDLLN